LLFSSAIVALKGQKKEEDSMDWPP
jgi:hypothetical protein